MMTHRVTGFQDLGAAMRRLAPFHPVRQADPSDLLEKEYHSLPFENKNTRCRVHLSTDGTTVLKTILDPSETAAVFRSWKSPLDEQPWAPVPGDELGSARFMRDASMVSATQAIVRAKEETGLLYVHLLPTDGLDGRLCLDGEVYDPNRVPFFVQRYARMLEDDLRDFGPDTESGCMALDKVLQFVVGFWREGMTDDTFRFHDSYGRDLQTGNVLLVDVGELLFGPPRRIVQEVDTQRTAILATGWHPGRSWLEDNYPQLVPHLKMRVAEWFTPEYVFNLK